MLADQKTALEFESVAAVYDHRLSYFTAHGVPPE
jgi:hypothetical protein